jgi:hypothetical protein
LTPWVEGVRTALGLGFSACLEDCYGHPHHGPLCEQQSSHCVLKQKTEFYCPRLVLGTIAPRTLKSPPVPVSLCTVSTLLSTRSGMEGPQGLYYVYLTKEMAEMCPLGDSDSTGSGIQLVCSVGLLRGPLGGLPSHRKFGPGPWWHDL